ERIHAFWVSRVNTKRDASDVVLRQTVRELRPGLAGVGGLVDAALGTTANHLSNGSSTLVRGGVQKVGILDVEHDVADAGVRTDRQHRIPGGSAVSGLVESPLTAGRPQRALRRNVNDVGIARVDDD